MLDNSNPLISVIIPVYNSRTYLNRMAECMSRQTYERYELLLIDDGSKDDSLEICENYAREDSRIRVYSKKNGGAYSARNYGLDKSSGEYVVFLDADDRVDDNYLEILMDRCREADIAVCDVSMEYDGRELGRFSCDRERLDPAEAIELLLTRRQINSGPCGKMLKRAVIQGIYFPPLSVYEDIVFVLEVLKRSSSIITTKDTVYHYMQHGDSTMGQASAAPSCDIITATDMLMEYIRDTESLPSGCCYITASHLLQYAVPWAVSCGYEDNGFLRKTRELYKKYLLDIVTCNAVPWKEKIIFILFSRSIVFGQGKLHRLKKRNHYE